MMIVDGSRLMGGVSLQQKPSFQNRGIFLMNPPEFKDIQPSSPNIKLPTNKSNSGIITPKVISRRLNRENCKAGGRSECRKISGLAGSTHVMCASVNISIIMANTRLDEHLVSVFVSRLSTLDKQRVQPF
jgi:hypothetical protein